MPGPRSAGTSSRSSSRRAARCCSRRRRSPSRTRPRTGPAQEWADEKIWDQLERRVETAGGRTLARGPVTARSVTPMRSYAHEPMRHGRLLLAGDAAHIVPPTGAKGFNLAVGDVVAFARALTHQRRTGSAELLHRALDATPFGDRIQLARLERLTTSRAAEADLADGHTGFPSLNEPLG